MSTLGVLMGSHHATAAPNRLATSLEGWLVGRLPSEARRAHDVANTVPDGARPARAHDLVYDTAA
jgi:hypothetical protein